MPTDLRITEVKASSDLIQMLDWDAAPKRWVPLNQRGKVTCDGCGEPADEFAECRFSCRFQPKCKLCRGCYLKRNNCAFLVEVQDVIPAHAKMADTSAQSVKIDSKNGLGSKAKET